MSPSRGARIVGMPARHGLVAIATCVGFAVVGALRLDPGSTRNRLLAGTLAMLAGNEAWNVPFFALSRAHGIRARMASSAGSSPATHASHVRGTSMSGTSRSCLSSPYRGRPRE